MSGTAAPASTTLSSTVRSEKKGLSRWITSASTPSSRTRTLDPPPRILNAIPSCRHRFSRATSSSSWRGLAKYAAGPPRRNQTSGARGTSSFTVPRKSSNTCIGLDSPPRKTPRITRYVVDFIDLNP